MTVIIEIFISCDGCADNYGVDDRFKSAKQHRSGYEKDGWKYIKRKDYCPKCLKTLKYKTSL